VDHAQIRIAEAGIYRASAISRPISNATFQPLDLCAAEAQEDSEKTEKKAGEVEHSN
jgi:hypothetical protein